MSQIPPAPADEDWDKQGKTWATLKEWLARQVRPAINSYTPVNTATAAPTTGTWTQGNIVWNSAPAAAGTPGWVCVVSGSPGTWKAMANLAA